MTNKEKEIAQRILQMSGRYSPCNISQIYLGISGKELEQAHERWVM